MQEETLLKSCRYHAALTEFGRNEYYDRVSDKERCLVRVAPSATLVMGRPNRACFILDRDAPTGRVGKHPKVLPISTGYDSPKKLS